VKTRNCGWPKPGEHFSCDRRGLVDAIRCGAWRRLFRTTTRGELAAIGVAAVARTAGQDTRSAVRGSQTWMAVASRLGQRARCRASERWMGRTWKLRNAAGAEVGEVTLARIGAVYFWGRPAVHAGEMTDAGMLAGAPSGAGAARGALR